MTIERLSPQDWPRHRAIRLRALLDAPNSFGTTWAEDQALPDQEWQSRLEDPHTAVFVATQDGADHGLVRAGTYGDQAGLYSMWVAPSARGHGIADALIQAVILWARERGHTQLVLDVADTNVRAIALYQRHGFEPTGVTGSLPPPRDHVCEHQRSLRLG